MKVHAYAEKLVSWLGEHQPATTAQFVANCPMDSRDAFDAVQYGLRHGVLERFKQPGASPAERAQYRLTGKALPRVKPAPAEPSFDGLLQAWGIASTPPQLSAQVSRKVQQRD